METPLQAKLNRNWIKANSDIEQLRAENAELKKIVDEHGVEMWVQGENYAVLSAQLAECQIQRDNYKSVAEAHSGAFQECIRLREQRDDLLAALKRLWLSCPTGLECNSFHHAKRDQHDFNQECGPAAEYLAAIEQADATISKVQK